MKAHQLLSDRSKWTRGAFAKNERGETCDADSLDAASWCLLGALRRCYEPRDVYRNHSRVSDIVTRRYGSNVGLMSFNDEYGYDAVMHVLREADV